MKIVLVGEAANHEQRLRPLLDRPHKIVALPRDAAGSAEHDAVIESDDVVVTLRWTREAGSPPFRLLHVPGAGLDGIDLPSLAAATMVANVFEHEVPIAEYVLARLLEWEIRACAMRAAFDPVRWPALYRDRVPHGEFGGRALGLVGYGRIGRAIAARAAAFGVAVTAVDDHAESDSAATVLPTTRLGQLLAGSDYLVLACPLTTETSGLIDAPALRAMPDHAVLVNIARAQIIEETALFAALRDGVIGGAILDVWYHYPASATDNAPPAAYPFWELPNVWCTPHSGAWTEQLPARRYAVIADNINRLAAGRPLRNVVPTPHRTSR
ncbi:2-hydroxyacid dehydrogenase [Pseudonocardia eucalypti]|uniref:2-hydroxyacid dehydrogenase n=1 Tax=Pseudonocardia eucalypti TaxID=648755 RepID=A0ABP9QAF1_9PSEU|nr:phosphoglycerate dehydrogenase-like enzyme [Pseudonocardia eucalypti]